MNKSADTITITAPARAILLAVGVLRTEASRVHRVRPEDAEACYLAARQITEALVAEVTHRSAAKRGAN